MIPNLILKLKKKSFKFFLSNMLSFVLLKKFCQKERKKKKGKWSEFGRLQ
jgi:hypothetical protein